MRLRRGRITRRGALATAAVMTLATPAFASLVVQNYMEADVSVTDACFKKVAGDDATTYAGTDANDPQVSFDGATNQITVDGAELIEEKLSVRGMQGDRVFYTDVVRYRNDCDIPLDIQLTAASVAEAGKWADKGARVYISSTPWDGTGAEPAYGVPGTTGALWDAQPITVAVGGNVSSDSTGTVTVPAGQQIRGAIAIVADHDASTNAADTATLNWIATASHAN